MEGGAGARGSFRGGGGPVQCGVESRCSAFSFGVSERAFDFLSGGESASAGEGLAAKKKERKTKKNTTRIRLLRSVTFYKIIIKAIAVSKKF